MEISNNQKKSVLLIMGLFTILSIVISLLTEDRLPYFLILSGFTTWGLFIIHSGKKVRRLRIENNILTINFYDRPFHLKEETYKIDEIKWFIDRVASGSVSTSYNLYGKNEKGELIFVLPEGLFLWSTTSLKYIRNYLESIGEEVKGVRI